MSSRLTSLLDHNFPSTKIREVRPEDEDSIKTVFHECDEDGKGFLNREDLKMTFICLFGYKPGKIQLNDIISKWSANEKECQIRLDQFMELMKERWRHYDEDDHIRSTFLAFDMKCQGFITVDDLKKVFSEIAPHISSSTIESAFREVDRDGDGRVGYKDFEFMMKYSTSDKF